MATKPPWGPRSDETPLEWFWRVLDQLWAEVSGPPPELSEADIVPEGAPPLCLRCLLPHHPLATYCPECGEIVNRWAPLFPLPYIWLWGRWLQDLTRWKRVSKLVWAGVVLIGVNWAGVAVGTYVLAWQPEGTEWHDRLNTASYLTSEAIHFLAGVALLRMAVRTWGTWREDGDKDSNTGTATEFLSESERRGGIAARDDSDW